MRQRLLAGGAALIVLLLAAYLFAAPAPPQRIFQGYIEGDLIQVSAEEGGRVAKLTVQEGDEVAAGQPLFSLEGSVQQAQADEAEARMRQAEAQLMNLRNAQQRPEQIAILRASEERAKAALDLSRNEQERQKKLFARGVSAAAQLDQAQAALERDEAALKEVRRQIEAASLSGRSAEIEAAEAALRAAKALAEQARIRLQKRGVNASAGGVVQEVYFRAGEVVSAGQPVVALLPPENLKARFYVPQARLAHLAPGDEVRISCDGCANDITARISFMSREAEFTPPVIFSREERAKLMFRVEARIEGHPALPLGLPIRAELRDSAP